MDVLSPLNRVLSYEVTSARMQAIVALAAVCLCVFFVVEIIKSFAADLRQPPSPPPPRRSARMRSRKAD